MSRLEDVGHPGAEKMQLVPHPKEEVVALGEFPDLLGLEIVLDRELLDRGDPQLDPRHPQGVLEIAQSAYAVLDIRLLVENRVRELGPPVRLVLQPGQDVVLRRFARVKMAVGLLEGRVQRLRAGDEPRLEEGGLGLHVLAGLDEDLLDRAGGMAGLQAAVPQDVEDLPGHVFLAGRDHGRLGLRRKKKHDVDVAPRGELRPAIPPERDQRDRRGRLVRPPVRRHGVIEQPRQQHIDNFRPAPRDRQAALPGRMARAQRRHLLLQEALARRHPRGDRGVVGENQGGRAAR